MARIFTDILGDPTHVSGSAGTTGVAANDASGNWVFRTGDWTWLTAPVERGAWPAPPLNKALSNQRLRQTGFLMPSDLAAILRRAAMFNRRM